MATSFTLNVNTEPLERLSESLGRLDGDAVERVALDVVNEVGERTYDLARGRMNAGLSLSDAYLRERMSFTPATPGARARATILARGDLTTLGHFAPAIMTQPVKNPSKSKGNPALNIPAGQKLAGVSVAVRRGVRKVVREQSGDVFMIPRFRDSEGNQLIFQRLPGLTSKGKSRLRALLGPSVYQLFRYQIEANALTEVVEDDLAETLARRAEAALSEVFE